MFYGKSAIGSGKLKGGHQFVFVFVFFLFVLVFSHHFSKRLKELVVYFIVNISERHHNNHTLIDFPN